MTESQPNMNNIVANIVAKVKAMPKTKKAMPKTKKAMPKTKNAKTAASGFSAERLCCSQPSVALSLESYFKSPIKHIKQIQGSKKSDIVVEFINDIPNVNLQVKNGDCGGGRGWSVDRRHVDNMDENPDLSVLLTTMCLKDGSNRKPDVSDVVSKRVLSACLVGVDEEHKPDYFIHTTQSIFQGSPQITSIGICSTAEFMTFMFTNVYATMITKRTCVHLNPFCYLQRKGGEKTDRRPNDIQTKIVLDSITIAALFVPIMQTTPQ